MNYRFPPSFAIEQVKVRGRDETRKQRRTTNKPRRLVPEGEYLVPGGAKHWGQWYQEVPTFNPLPQPFSCNVARRPCRVSQSKHSWTILFNFLPRHFSPNFQKLHFYVFYTFQQFQFETILNSNSKQ